MSNPLKSKFILLALLLWATGCQEALKPRVTLANVVSGVPGEALQTKPPQGRTPADLNSLPDTALGRLSDYSAEFTYDLRYAPNNNFMGETVYNCSYCNTLVKTARALISAKSEMM